MWIKDAIQVPPSMVTQIQYKRVQEDYDNMVIDEEEFEAINIALLPTEEALVKEPNDSTEPTQHIPE